MSGDGHVKAMLYNKLTRWWKYYELSYKNVFGPITARNKPFSTRTEELSTVEVTVKYVRFR
jgi:hypothetical protein